MQQAVPESLGVRVLPQDLTRVARLQRVGDPLQNVIQRASSQCCSVKIRLHDFGSLGGVEAGCIIAMSSGASLDRSCGERLSSPLSNHRIDAANNRIPYHRRNPWGQSKRVKDCHRPLLAALGDTQQQIIGLRQGDQRRAWSAQ